MSRPVFVNADSNAYDAAVLLFTEDIGTIFVGDVDDVLGVVSRKDLLKAAMGREDLAKVPISMVMTSRSKMPATSRHRLPSTSSEANAVPTSRLTCATDDENSVGSINRNGWNAMLCWIYHNGATMPPF